MKTPTLQILGGIIKFSFFLFFGGFSWYQWSIGNEALIVGMMMLILLIIGHRQARKYGY